MTRRQRLFGWLALFGSAICFYLATLIINWGQPYVRLDAAYYVQARFLLGFIFVLCTLIFEKKIPRSHGAHALIGRAITNTAAVLFFYKAVEVSTVASANILNMTYPIFVAILSWFFLRTQRDIASIFIVALSTFGIWLILRPGLVISGRNDTWGLLSGISAGFSMIYLAKCRQRHDSSTILFYVFGLGMLFMAPFLWRSLFLPNATEIFFLVVCSIAGVVGQYLLTYGFLYVSAVEGSVISSSRILIAAFLGSFLASDPSLTLSGWVGALLIFAANIALAVHKPRPLLDNK